MIIGGFDGRGRPYVECLVVIPRLGTDENIRFLLDTGADNASLHTLAARSARIPFDQLADRTDSPGIGGESSYFRELAFHVFDDNDQRGIYTVELRIAGLNDSNWTLPTILGLNVINHWYVQDAPTNSRLEYKVRYADHMLETT